MRHATYPSARETPPMAPSPLNGLRSLRRLIPPPQISARLLPRLLHQVTCSCSNVDSCYIFVVDEAVFLTIAAFHCHAGVTREGHTIPNLGRRGRYGPVSIGKRQWANGDN